jgi:phosphatidylglycerophosphate synthase
MSTLKEKQVEKKNKDDNDEPSSDEDKINVREEKDEIEISKLIIISHDCPFSVIWRILYIQMNLFSAYFYSWLACFGEESVRIEYRHSMQILFEVFFLISIVIFFITEYTDMSPDGDPMPIRDLSKIARNYRDNGSFYIDFITILPIYHLSKGFHYHFKATNSIKVLRLYNSLKFFNVVAIMKALKELMKKRVLK